MSSTTNELEILLKKAVTLLQSAHANSATELRLLLDEEIKKRHHAADKTLTSNMTKKQLEDEANFPGRAVTPPPQPVEAEEVINLTNSPAKTISDSSDDEAVSGVGGGLMATAEDEANLKEFGDLNCCVCGEMMFTATNRLIECSKCGTLYHQECHKPPITDEEAEDQGHNWQCENCTTKPTAVKSSGSIMVIPEEPMPLVATSSVASIKSKSSATSSRSSSSSNSSSPFYKMEQAATTTAAGKITSSTTKSLKEERTVVGSSSSKITTLNAPSSSSSSSSSKKHSSSSSSTSSKTKSSKHHDSKRKSSK